MELYQCQFFFQLDDPLRERFALGTGAAISAALAANCAIGSAMLGSPVRVIRFLNLNRPCASILNYASSASNLILPQDGGSSHRYRCHRDQWSCSVISVTTAVSQQGHLNRSSVSFFRTTQQQTGPIKEQASPGHACDCRRQTLMEQTGLAPSTPLAWRPLGC